MSMLNFMKNKKIDNANRIFIIIILLLMILAIYDLFKVIGNSVLLFSDISYLVIYTICILGLFKNNKNWAWILAALPSLWQLLNPLRRSEFSYRYGFLLQAGQALIAGDPASAGLAIISLYIPFAILIFITINLIKFIFHPKILERKNKKMAVIIAIFFSIFVWLYLKKYKKFFISLAVLGGYALLEYLVIHIGGLNFMIISTIGNILPIIFWILSLLDAFKFNNE